MEEARLQNGMAFYADIHGMICLVKRYTLCVSG